MTAPDLTMWERIAEALWDSRPLASWGGPSWADLDGGPTRDRYLARADAVLTVLADLPDTAVEAGAKADWDMTDGKRWGKPWEDVHPELKADRRECMRRVLTAAIAAIKEGKA